MPLLRATRLQMSAAVLIVAVAVAGIAAAMVVPVAPPRAASVDLVSSNAPPAPPASILDRAPAPSSRSAPMASIASGPSNILPADYVGPDACKRCHEAKHKQWSQHPHSRMNLDATDESVRADFKDRRVSFPQGDAVFSRDADGTYTMTLEHDGRLLRKYRVTRTIGSRFMQFFIGLEVEGPEPRGHQVYSVEHRLPFAYWFRLKRWLPHHYFDPLGPERGPDGALVRDDFAHPQLLPWEQNCLLCHNTYAYVYRLALGGTRTGFGPDDLVFSKTSVQETAAQTLDDFARAHPTRADVPDRLLVTLGISCESCHFGSRAHAVDGATPMILPTSPMLAMSAQTKKELGDWRDPHFANAVCTQCHSADASTTGGTFPNGAAAGNSREALDLAAGKCTTAIRCLDCHDPHRTVGREGQPDSPQHIGACIKCHDRFASAPVRKAHAGHPAGVDVTCLDCHMPRMAQGIDQVVRSHAISSPTDVRMLAAGSVNACNLCHLDRSIRWTLEGFAKSWGKRIDPTPEWTAAYGGNLDAPVGQVWLHGPAPATRVAAVHAYAQSPQAKAHAADLIGALEDPVPVNRVLSIFAVEKATGQKLSVADFDPAADPAVRARQIAALLARAPR